MAAVAGCLAAKQIRSLYRSRLSRRVFWFRCPELSLESLADRPRAHPAGIAGLFCRLRHKVMWRSSHDCRESRKSNDADCHFTHPEGVGLKCGSDMDVLRFPAGHVWLNLPQSGGCDGPVQSVAKPRCDRTRPLRQLRRYLRRVGWLEISKSDRAGDREGIPRVAPRPTPEANGHSNGTRYDRARAAPL